MRYLRNLKMMSNLIYSLGVVLKRALALSEEWIDGSEIDFGIKQELDAWVLFIYDTAKVDVDIH